MFSCTKEKGGSPVAPTYVKKRHPGLGWRLTDLFGYFFSSGYEICCD